MNPLPWTEAAVNDALWWSDIYKASTLLFCFPICLLPTLLIFFVLMHSTKFSRRNNFLYGVEFTLAFTWAGLSTYLTAVDLVYYGFGINTPNFFFLGITPVLPSICDAAPEVLKEADNFPCVLQFWKDWVALGGSPDGRSETLEILRPMVPDMLEGGGLAPSFCSFMDSVASYVGGGSAPSAGSACAGATNRGGA
jgi:hypothetical protein